MRDYGKVHTSFWTDCFGNVWPPITSNRRLKFKYPLHAAFRKHVFHTDNYQCRRCENKVVEVPEGWDGKHTLATQTMVDGYAVCLVVDHILTLKAGGKNEVSNFQTLCETCNRKKMKEDLENIKKYKEVNSNG